MSTDKPKLSTVLKNRNFSLVFLGGLISDIGSNFAFIAFLFLAIQFTSHLSDAASAQAVALIMVVQIIPSLVVGPFAGVFVDRFDRKKIMVAADLLGGFSTLAVLWASNIDQLYVIGFINAFTRIFFYPARGASIPKLVEPNQLVQANGITQTMTQLSSLIGPAIAGVIVYRFGYDVAFMIDAISFFISAMMIITITSNLKPETDGSKMSAKQVLGDMKEGVELVLHDKVIAYILTLFVLLLLGIGMVNPLLAFYLSNSFGLTEQDFGFLVSFSAITGFITAIVLTVKGKIDRKVTMVTSSTFIIAISLGLLGYAPYTALPVVALYISMAFIGMINISLNVPLSALFQAIIEDKNLGKINAFMGTALAVAQLSSASIATYLAGFLSISTILIAVGAFTGLIGIVGIIYLKSSGLEHIAQLREVESIERKMAQKKKLEERETLEMLNQDNAVITKY
ncbi:MAG: MFS transporter [Candidatus Heimdallarchaeota archaeon]|nr:MFS transporter [Candidatus Heimdallarchaeota archaeon]